MKTQLYNNLKLALTLYYLAPYEANINDYAGLKGILNTLVFPYTTKEEIVSTLGKYPDIPYPSVCTCGRTYGHNGSVLRYMCSGCYTRKNTASRYNLNYYNMQLIAGLINEHCSSYIGNTVPALEAILADAIHSYAINLLNREILI